MNPFYYPFYFLLRAIKGIRDHLFLNVITIVIITLSMFIFGLFAIFFLNIKALIDYWEGRVVVSVYIDDSVANDRQKLSTLKERIEGVEGISGLRYISKEDAYRSFKEELGSFGELLEGLKENPIPASFEISLDRGTVDGDEVERIANKILGLHGVDDVDYGGEWIERLSLFFFALRLVMVILSGFLFLTTMLIISNTIRLTLFSRRREIEIMRLVGATDAFIKAPFVIEGMLQGLIGAVLAGVILVVSYMLIKPRIQPILGFVLGGSPPVVSITYVFFGLLFLGTSLGILGSIISLRRFLEV